MHFPFLHGRELITNCFLNLLCEWMFVRASSQSTVVADLHLPTFLLLSPVQTDLFMSIVDNILYLVAVGRSSFFLFFFFFFFFFFSTCSSSSFFFFFFVVVAAVVVGRRLPGGERREKKKRYRQSSMKGREEVIVSRTNIGTVSEATLGKASDTRGGAHMGFSELIDTILN